MAKIKYISLAELREELDDVIEDVFKNEVEYIVMVDRVPKVKISTFIGKDGKKVFVSEEVDKEQLKEFVD